MGGTTKYQYCPSICVMRKAGHRRTLSFSEMAAAPRIEEDSKVNIEWSFCSQFSVYAALLCRSNPRIDYPSSSFAHRMCCSRTLRTALQGILISPAFRMTITDVHIS
jgi:hypothetical protein